MAFSSPGKPGTPTRILIPVTGFPGVRVDGDGVGVEASTEGTIRSATLSSSAISKISSSRGSSVGIGVSLESYSGQTLDTEWATFAVDTEARTHQLRIVVVP